MSFSFMCAYYASRVETPYLAQYVITLASEGFIPRTSSIPEGRLLDL